MTNAATSHDGKWRQNVPWYSTIWFDVDDVNDVVSLLVEKLHVNVFMLQFYLLYQISRQILGKKE